MHTANTIDTPLMDDVHKNQVSAFIESINCDLSNRAKESEGSEVNSAEEIPEEDQLLNFSNRKLIFKDDTYLNYYGKTQKWLGHITEVNGDVFKAKLEDLTHRGTAEFGEFDWEEVSEEDRPLVQVGAAFYWSIGFSHEKGQIIKSSFVRFQRVLKWDGTYMDNAVDRAERLSKNLKWE
jgi:hypothetical protein